MNITYNGHYGARNTGDDAFVEVAAWGTEKFWGVKDHCFLAKELPGIITDNVRNHFPYSNYYSFLESLLLVYKSDIFLSAGGSTLYAALKKTDLRYYAQYKKAIKRTSRIGAIGVSLGPYKSLKDEKEVVAYLKKMDFLALRDE